MYPILYTEKLKQWYEAEGRDLPWRQTYDPYKIWVSEIILQQTQVVQGMDYYLRFIERFPTVVQLSQATEDDVLRLWQGLGYYSRARNMHAASHYIVQELGGKMPSTYDDLLKLKGVGVYTAAAIAAFAYNLPCACVDGNVYRVLARLFDQDLPIDTGEGQRWFRACAQDFMARAEPRLHSYAMMDFGALCCTPRQPKCDTCPLNEHCVAYALGHVMERPVKKGKLKKVDRYFTFIQLWDQALTYVEKRKGNGIWRGLYQFPLIESKTQKEVEDLILEDEFRALFKGEVRLRTSTPVIKHVLSHQNIYARLLVVEGEVSHETKEKYSAVSATQLEELPFPVLLREKMGLDL